MRPEESRAGRCVVGAAIGVLASVMADAAVSTQEVVGGVYAVFG